MKPVAIVTGGARNIGWSIVNRLATDFQVVIADLSPPEGVLPEDATYFPVNVADPDAVDALIEYAAKQGAITALVHSAAITAPVKPFLDVTLDEWRRVVDINLTGTFILAQAAMAHLVRNKGSLTLLSSRAAKTGYAALIPSKDGTKPHYCASKAGVISLMKSLAIEFAPDVRVNAVAPGPIEGDMIPRERWSAIAKRVPLDRLGKTEEIADAVHFLISPAASFITGHVLDVNGGTLMD